GDETSEAEAEVSGIIGHKREGRRLVFLVEWVDGDLTWQSLASIKDCVALDEYLARFGVGSPRELP
ncbi:hypothetical protein FB107DRAFT_191859, partial [Schizophyllum commune]